MAHSLWSPSAAERNMNCAGAACFHKTNQTTLHWLLHPALSFLEIEHGEMMETLTSILAQKNL